MNPMSIEMEQDWRGAGDGLLVLIVLVAYMAAIHKLFEWSRVSEKVAKVLWGAACLLPLGYLLSVATSYSIGTIGIAASVLFYWFVGKEILTTKIAERQNLENVRREIEIEVASQVIEPTPTGTKYAMPGALPHRGTERTVTGNNGGDPANFVAPCPSCGQKLRIPAGKSLNVTCAKCRSQFLVKASGEIARHKFRIIETVGSGSASALDGNVANCAIEPSEVVTKCFNCGLERRVSREVMGFHCAGCTAYNLIGSAAQTTEDRLDCDSFTELTELKSATICAVIGCNEAIPPGRIVCPRHG